MAASFFALVIHLLAFRLEALRAEIDPGFPRRLIAGFLFFAGVGTAVAWLPAPLAALLSGETLPLLGPYTTSITNVIDLGLIVPASIAAGILVWRRSPLGILVACVLLGIVVMLAPLMTGQTLVQLRAGVELSTGEIVGILGVFGLLSLLGMATFVALLRHVGAGRASATG
jgi:hypothetical protein